MKLSKTAYNVLIKIDIVENRHMLLISFMKSEHILGKIYLENNVTNMKTLIIIKYIFQVRKILTIITPYKCILSLL